MSKSENDLFDHKQHALEKEYEICPECGSELTLKQGKHGTFIGCNNYPACSYTRPVHVHEHTILKELDEPSCPECSGTLAVKNGRYGMFIGCMSYPECHYIAHLEEPDDTHVVCPSCEKGHLVHKHNRYGKSFYACDQYPGCKYVVNHSPVNKSCPDCGWKILLEKNTTKGVVEFCSRKECSYQNLKV